MTTTKNNLDPRTWSKRNKIIAAIAASVAVILAIAGIGLAVFGSQSHNAKDCTSYQQILTDKTAELDQAIQDAKDALKTVDASLKPGEGTRLAHTDGFPLSSEGQTAINDLSKAISAAKSAKEAEDAKVNADATDKKQCSDKQDTTSIDAAIKAIKDQTQSFIDVRDAYRLTKATDEANELMDTAKSNLASAQQSAAEQIAAVDADPSMESDASVKAAYDALKAVETESHTLSTTVTVTTYDEAVASIEKAKTIEEKAAQVTASVAPLQEAITTYQAAKAGSAPASTTPDTSAPEQGASTGNSNTPAPSYGYNGNGGSSNSGSNSPSYSGGSSYTPPAPAPAPAPPANNSGSGDGRIDFGPGQADRPGCVIIEGRSVC